MMWIVAKAESRFNREQDESENRAIEVVQVFETENEAEKCWEICSQVAGCDFIYIVITEDQIGEWVR